MSSLRVYFEKQGPDRLCGVHCLNSLAQGPVFSQADLNKYASDIDKEEAALLAADPTRPKPPRQMTIASLSNQPKSEHQDVTGYFSLPVLEKALSTKFGISVHNAARKDIIQQINREGLESHEGFVIHLRDHWFAARAIPNPEYEGVREWFFLDSLKTGPMPVTENELWGTLQGIIQSGGNVFVLSGGRLPAPQTASSKPLVLKSHQYVFTREEIKRRLAGDSSEPTQQENRKKQQETDWASLGTAQTLGSSKPLPVATPVTTMNISLKAEPALSEPADRVSTVLVRLPSGQRQVRRFSLDHDTVSDLFSWIDSIGGGSLVGTMDKRGWKLWRKSSDQFALQTASSVDPVIVDGYNPVSSVGIKSGQEAFNLSSSV
jgi:hypothetical protein